MPEFHNPTDIANRALQRVGAQMLDPSLGFADGSDRANQVSFAYGKLRRAELQRSYWRFAVREAAIRAVDVNTMLVGPALFSASTTYFQGSVVSDPTGTLWESTQRDNLGNDPETTVGSWKPYFGPLTAEPFDSSLSYYNGEIVYTMSGAGTFNAYKSMVSANAVHPACPSLWQSNSKYNVDDVVVVWPAWAIGTTYSKGGTVLYTDGNVYSSLTNSNVGNTPPSSGTNWQLMPVLIQPATLTPASAFPAPPLITTTPVDEWGIQTQYSPGTFVLYNATLYLSIGTGSGNFPNAAASTFWAACTGGTSYQSLIDGNQANNPANAPALWAIATTYAIGNMVGASDGVIYTSLSNANTGNNPVTDGGVHWQSTGVLNPWTTVFVLGGGNSFWIQIGGSASPSGIGISAYKITYPVGCGPLSQSWTENVYRLPSGFIRRAPQQPRAGSFSWRGAPGNLSETDWQFEGQFLVTWDSRAIVLRFVADVQNVTDFHDLFCESLAARIALEIAEPITQSTAKLQVIAQEYKKFQFEAITVDAIDAAPTEPALDDLIACRF